MIGHIAIVIVIKLGNVEVLLSVVELVDIGLDVPVREVLTDPQLACFEWLIVDQREDFLLRCCVIDDFPPDFSVG